MSTARLLFLYPQLARSARLCESTLPIVARDSRSVSRRHGGPTRRTMNTAARHEQQFGRRHGKAVQPSPSADADKSIYDSSEEFAKAANLDKILKDVRTPQEDAKAEEAEPAEKEDSTEQEPSEEPEVDKDPGVSPDPLKGEEATPTDMVLYMQPPQGKGVYTMPAFHLHPAPYVHHFDTYTLVNRLQDGGFSEQQAVTSMKALRMLLAENLDIAKEQLMSKGDVDNENYLFSAACSELKTEIQNNRKQKDERTRQERTILQHEADILSQNMTQELAMLKDNVKGMFNDRQMAVREEQRAMEAAIQELNYKITIRLQSDSKSQVEGVRWVLTRRAVIALVFSALMILTFLRFVSYRTHEEQEERRRRERLAQAGAADTELLRQMEKHGQHDLAAAGAAEILSAS